MPRNFRAAAVQMDAAPAPLDQRLARAAMLIAQAASEGAQLVVLPELFNSGYVYDSSNYALAERLDGPTVTWMKQQAAARHIYLAGTLLLLDEEDVYNAALLVAPDGQTWRYDKQYPFAWERAYFRENRQITIAETPFGRLGMMICWDSAHPDLWARYAGKVDGMLIMSCPPKLSACDLVFPDGRRVNTSELSGPWSLIYAEVEHFPGVDMDEHAAWLGVPVVHAMGSGQFRSRMPNPTASLSAFTAARPDLWRYLPRASAVYLEAGYDLQTKIVDGGGQIAARVLNVGDGVAVADLTLAEDRPVPASKQPRMRTSPLAYLFADAIAEPLATTIYRAGVRRQWGARMAPIDPRTRVWVGAAATIAAAGLIAGRVLRRGRHRNDDLALIEAEEPPDGI